LKVEVASISTPSAFNILSKFGKPRRVKLFNETKALSDVDSYKSSYNYQVLVFANSATYKQTRARI
jgi:hypothetical protein